MSIMIVSENTKIIINLKDTLDYKEYLSRCIELSIAPDNLGVFLQTAGMVLGAKRRNPLLPEQGYQEIITEMNKAFTERVQAASLPGMPITTPVNKKGCCGGGKVR